MKRKDQHTAVGITWEAFPYNRPWGLVYEDGTPVMRKPNEGIRQFPAHFQTTEQAVNFVNRHLKEYAA